MKGSGAMTRVFVSCAIGVMLVVMLMISASAQVSNEITLVNQADDVVASLTDVDLMRLAIEL